MTLSGTIVDGQVRLDRPADLPDGTRVTLLPPEEAFEYPHPMAPYDRDKELALLRESIAQMDAGGVGRSADEVFDEIERELERAPAGRG